MPATHPKPTEHDFKRIGSEIILFSYSVANDPPSDFELFPKDPKKPITLEALTNLLLVRRFWSPPFITGDERINACLRLCLRFPRWS